MEIFKGPPQVVFYVGEDWWILLFRVSCVVIALVVVERGKPWIKYVQGGLLAGIALVLSGIVHELGHAIVSFLVGGEVIKIGFSLAGGVVLRYPGNDPARELFVISAGWLATYVFAFLVAIFARGEKDRFWKMVLLISCLLIFVIGVPEVSKKIPRESDGFLMLVDFLWWVGKDQAEAALMVEKYLWFLYPFSLAVTIASSFIFVSLLKRIIFHQDEL